MQRGSVIFWPKYLCTDGEVKDKYVVFLNDPEKHDRVISVMTTSQQRKRGQIKGCQPSPAAFFLPEGTTPFPLDTWLVFTVPPDLTFKENVQKRIDSGKVQEVFVLREQLVNEIRNCLLKNCELLTERHEKYLR